MSSAALRLYLVPNDPARTTLVSANGVAHYQVATARAHALAPPVTRVPRSAESAREACVAEVEWRRFGAHPVVRSNVFDGAAMQLQVTVRELLYKVGRKFTMRVLWSVTRYFLGNGDKEYRWKPLKHAGHVLTHQRTGREVGRFAQETVAEGFFKAETKWCLQIQPTTLDIDLVVVTFLIMEKRRRDRVVAEGMNVAGNSADDDVVEGGCEGGMGG